MAAKTTNATARTTPIVVEPPRPASALPLTTAERLQRIEAMGKRIGGYIAFMAEVPTLNGTSAEAKDRAVEAFHDRLVVLEGQLARIQDELKLG
jgi:hypothetical protein